MLSTAGCATTTTPPPPIETQIPVGTPCLTADKVPARPDFVTDAQLAAKPDGQLVLALGSDRLARQDYEGKLEATISGCVGKAPVPAGTVVPATPEARPWWRFW